MENPVDILILDYKKPEESRQLLESIKLYCSFDYRVVFYDNGSKQNYSQEFKDQGLIDELIISPENQGLGIGTRDLFAAAKSEYCLYIQNDQFFFTELNHSGLDWLKNHIDFQFDNQTIKSISLAGNICGHGIYSERAHLIKSDFYQKMEKTIPLSIGGCGPFHHIVWREEQIQNYYKQNNYFHAISPIQFVMDNGRRAIRSNPDGSEYEHLPDTKELKVIKYPTEKYIYPKWTDQEWEEVLKTRYWPDWKIPENEIKDSFTVPQWH